MGRYLFGAVGATIGSLIGGWIGSALGMAFFGQFIIGTILGGFGTYYAVKWAKNNLE